MKKLITLLAITTLYFSFTTIPKTTNTYELSDDFSITISGSSNIHDWTSTVQEISGTANIAYDENGGFRIDNCEVSIPVSSIKSTKGSIMDYKTWNALNEVEHPIIRYSLNNFDNVMRTGNSFTADSEGMLDIAGTSNMIFMDIKGSELGSGNIEITGKKSLKMTEFNIDPPTALFGTLTTGDEITLEFRIILQR